MDSIAGKREAPYEAAWSQASTRARGSFADILDALTVALHDRARLATRTGAEREALAASRAVEFVESAKEQVAHNVSPQLLTVNLIRDLQDVFS
jgi:phage-related minor tail protein